MLLELMAEDLRDPRDAARPPRSHAGQNAAARMPAPGRNSQRVFAVRAVGRTRTGRACDLNQLVRDFIEFYKPEASDHGIEISPHLASDLPPVRVDRSLFRQMLLNLALNAQQAMPDGGCMELQTSFARRLACNWRSSTTASAWTRRLGPSSSTSSFPPRWAEAAWGCRQFVKLSRRTRDASPAKASRGRGTRFVISFPPAQS